MGYFGLAAQLKLFDKLDQWLRRRLRMCYWGRLAVCPARADGNSFVSAFRGDKRSVTPVVGKAPGTWRNPSLRESA